MSRRSPDVASDARAEGGDRDRGDQSYVFVVTGSGTVDRRAVTTGGTDGDRVEILGGLNAGERVSSCRRRRSWQPGHGSS